MPNIESSGFPLGYKIQESSFPALKGGTYDSNRLALRVQVRALEGMQKEAIVSTSFGNSWRMVSDEGPYLNGTDLAPFPLAFYTAGMQFSFMSEFLRHAKEHRVEINSVEFSQENYYTMEGSALKGTMLGGAKPAELSFKIESDASEEMIRKLILLAESSSPAQAVMRDVLANTFSLKLNSEHVPVTDVNGSPKEIGDDPEKNFESIQPTDNTEFLPDIISKVSGTEKVFGVEGGGGRSLHATQKRTLHVHGEVKVVDNMLLETTIRLFNPIGSVFRFLCDESPDRGGQASAPPPLAYLSAGVAFCYMTQIGRYAHITKQDLKNYQIVQDNVFEITGSVADWSQTAKAFPMDTQVFLDANESIEIAQKTVSMGERTCFLHAAMRGSHPSIIKVELNGNVLPSF